MLFLRSSFTKSIQVIKIMTNYVLVNGALVLFAGFSWTPILDQFVNMASLLGLTVASGQVVVVLLGPRRRFGHI